VNNNLEAEDIMQESFLKAFEKIKMYKGEVSFGAWLKRIVINHSLDELRKKKFEMESIDDSFTELKEKKDDKGMIKEEELKIKAEEIRDEIKKLPDGYRIVLSLYLIEGYDHDEISEILNISSSTSRSQCARAKQKLLKNIQEKAKTNLI
jgi:RNA polymerase sigma-70 factor (ECF subfamily)